MIRALAKSFSHHQRLRSLNRALKFEEVKSTYESLYFSSQVDRQKSFQQYSYAINYLNKIQLALAPSPSPSPAPVAASPAPVKGKSIEDPLYIQKVTKSDPNISKVRLHSGYILSILSAVALGYILFSQSKSGPMASILSSDHMNTDETGRTTFSDVKGISECKAELEELVDFLKYPDKYHSAGAKMPKGILLTGKPGTGKTLLAKAVSGEANVKFFYSSGADFEEVFVGLGARRLRELFSEAKRQSPCIVFIDEIDAVGASRKANEFNYNRQTLNQLLVEMDGFKATDNVLVIGATNFPESLDHALKRAGRFDKMIDIPMPDLAGRREIVELYLSKVNHDETVDSLAIARGSTGMTGADLANLINLSALNSVKWRRSAINSADVEFAKDRVLMGVERKSLVMSDHDKYLTAIHEVGHALTAHFTRGAYPLHKTTILPRGPALGVTIMLPEKDDLTFTREQILAQIDVSMGGRAAEELFLGTEDLTTGCSDDLHKATQLAYYHVKAGMFDEKTGLVNANSLKDEGLQQRNEFDKVVREILDESYGRVKRLLKENKRNIEKIARKLLESETLTREQIVSLLSNNVLLHGMARGQELSWASQAFTLLTQESWVFCSWA